LQESEFTAGDGSKTQMLTTTQDDGSINSRGKMPNNHKKVIQNMYYSSEQGQVLHLQILIATADGRDLVSTHRQFKRK
jgi:general stress protein 26